MLHTIFLIIVLSVFWAVVMYGLGKLLFELVYLCALIANPYRVYHILAFFLVLLVAIFSVIFYFDKFIELAKLLDT